LPKKYQGEEAKISSRVEKLFKVFFFLPGIFFSLLVLPTLLNTGIPVSYDLPDHYHFSRVFLNGPWDDSWGAGYTVISYLPVPYFISSMTLKIFGFSTMTFKLFLLFSFMALIYSTFWLFQRFGFSKIHGCFGALIFATSPYLLYAYIAGWYTTIISLIFFNMFVGATLEARKNKSKVWVLLAAISLAGTLSSHVYSYIAVAGLVLSYFTLDIFKYFQAKKEGRKIGLTTASKNVQITFTILLLGSLVTIPAIVPFLSFLMTVGEQKPSPHISRMDPLWNVYNNFLLPLGPTMLFLLSLTMILMCIRAKEFWKEIVAFKVDFQAALIFFILMAWISLGPSISPIGIIPFAKWLTYDRFMMYSLPLLIFVTVQGSKFFIVNDIKKALKAKRRIPTRLVTFTAIIILLTGVGTSIATKATYDWLGYSYGSTFDVPREVVNYFQNEKSKGEWGRILALGMPAYYQIIPDLTGVPLINIPYATARLLSFLRESGASDFAEAKFFPNGSFIINYVLLNYDLYGIKWIVLKDAYYEQFIPIGHFKLVLNISDKTENIRIYEAFAEINFVGCDDPKALYNTLLYTDFKSIDNIQIGIGGGAKVATLDRNTEGIQLVVETNGTWGWGFITIPLNIPKNLPCKDTFLLIKSRSQSNGFLGIRVINKTGVETLVENACLFSEWMVLTFRSNSLTSNSTLSIGIGGSKLKEQLEIKYAMVGVPVLYAKKMTPGNIVITRNATEKACGIIVKEAFYPLWSTLEAKLYRSNDFLCLDIPEGVTYVELQYDNRLYMLHVASAAVIVIAWCAIAILALLRGVENRKI